MDLELPEGAFYRLTPREFYALVDRHHEREQHARHAADYRTGMVLATLVNLHRDPKKRPRPWLPHDFFPSLPAPQPVIQPAEVLLRKAEALNQLFGGRDLRKNKPPPLPSHSIA